MLNLHSLYPSIGSKKKSKRVGRGDGSGSGTYSGRGLKGQRSRSGGKSGLKLRGLKQMILSTPKLPGFKSKQPKNQVIKLSQLEKVFKTGDEVNKTILKEKGLIQDINLPVKILNNGELEKKLVISGVLASKAAKKKIEAAGGELKE